MTAKEVVAAYWQAMESNDFTAVAQQWLSESYECCWPQSAECIVGRENFAALNATYPAQGLWHFTVECLLSEGDQVVSYVRVTDGVQQALAITLHTVVGQQIVRQIEYWPDDYPAPAWRQAWVKMLDTQARATLFKA